eukprot:gene17540-biopygen14413
MERCSIRNYVSVPVGSQRLRKTPICVPKVVQSFPDARCGFEYAAPPPPHFLRRRGGSTNALQPQILGGAVNYAGSAGNVQQMCGERAGIVREMCSKCAGNVRGLCGKCAGHVRGQVRGAGQVRGTSL